MQVLRPFLLQPGTRKAVKTTRCCAFEHGARHFLQTQFVVDPVVHTVTEKIIEMVLDGHLSSTTNISKTTSKNLLETALGIV